MFTSTTANKKQNTEKSKLIIVPSYVNALGGTTVSLALLIKGIKNIGLSDQVRVLVKSGTLLEDYFKEAGLAYCLEILNSSSYFKSALEWVHQQPKDWPLLLDNTVDRKKLPRLVQASAYFRTHRRPVYHFCHDLALSYNELGNLARKLTFACLSPKAICNSYYTASHIRSIIPDICGVLYQPVDIEQINGYLSLPAAPPNNMKKIVDSGAKILLTPSRINQPGIVNDKNLRSILPVLSILKKKGHLYHSVIIGEDVSDEKRRTRDLLNQAELLDIADRLTILPPTYAMNDYYKFSDCVLMLSPREPFGRVVIEATAHGKPIVGSNTGGVNEILKNFAPNWTVNPFNSAEIADKLIEVAGSKNNSEMIERGRIWIQEHCKPEKYAEDIMKIVGLAA